MAVNNSGSDKVELHFISSCVPTKPPAVHDDEQLLINLQECHDVNRPSQHDTWSGKLIIPLRDRLVYRNIVCCYGDGYQDNDIMGVWIKCC